MISFNFVETYIAQTTSEVTNAVAVMVMNDLKVIALISMNVTVLSSAPKRVFGQMLQIRTSFLEKASRSLIYPFKECIVS